MSSGVTFHGLHEWHKHIFEHLGWMILANNHNMPDKVSVYTTSLDRFLVKSQKYLDENRTLTQDKINDILVLRDNIKTLQKDWKKLIH